MKSKVDYEKIFWLFAGEDESREELNRPFKQEGMYYATDAHSLILLPVEKAELNFPEQYKPKAWAVVPQESDCNVEINLADIERQLIPDLTDETITEEVRSKCTNSDCEKGVVECDMGHDHECPTCYGEGEIIESIEKPTGKKKVREEKLFKMLGVGFQYKQLRRFVDACNLMGVKTVTKTFGTAWNKANLFKCGEATILIMPAIISGDEEGEFKPIEIIL
jgi:hypothetical protein